MDHNTETEKVAPNFPPFVTHGPVWAVFIRMFQEKWVPKIKLMKLYAI